MQDLLDQMRRRVLRHASEPRWETPLPRVGIAIYRKNSPPPEGVCPPGFCLVLRGAKRMLVGERLLRLEAGTCFASLVELATTRHDVETDGDDPYVATTLTVDHDAFTALVAELPPAPANTPSAAFGVTPATPPLLDAWDRHLALLDAPEDIPALAAARERELLYRILQSPHGPMLRQIASADSRLSQVRRAIDWLRRHFDERVETKALAAVAGMSVPSFHRHFRAVTAISPLQYQKALRLQAARRLLATSSDAANAAYEVGYESASQFSREYARYFGLPPRRDAEQLRGARQP